jgi:hypothetical protein
MITTQDKLDFLSEIVDHMNSVGQDVYARLAFLEDISIS